MIGLSALGYYLPPARRSIADLVAASATTSDAGKLAALGFGHIHDAGDLPVEALALGAVRDLQQRSGFDLEQVDVVIYGGSLATSSVVEPGAAYAWAYARNPVPLFKFPALKLQAELGLPRAQVLGVGQLACNAFQGCMRVARGLLAAEPEIGHVLCVAADRFGPDANREVVFNLMSDGACAGIVSRDAPGHRILAHSQVSRGIYWDGESSHDRLVAAYFPLAKQAIGEALDRAGLRPAELALLVPHNINRKSWEILAEILDWPPERIYTDNIARVGHVVASDNVINHLDAQAAGRIVPGDRVAWFVTGFGAHWSCTILEV